MEFVTGMQEWPREIRVVHGEPQAKQVLAAQLHKQCERSNCLLDVLG
ncbi:MBL fold metallo-hydrolase RNA specificity domain-containing protein [Stutzerimonas stutzeri]